MVRRPYRFPLEWSRILSPRTLPRAWIGLLTFNGCEYCLLARARFQPFSKLVDPFERGLWPSWSDCNHEPLSPAFRFLVGCPQEHGFFLCLPSFSFDTETRFTKLFFYTVYASSPPRILVPLPLSPQRLPFFHSVEDYADLRPSPPSLTQVCSLQTPFLSLAQMRL